MSPRITTGVALTDLVKSTERLPGVAEAWGVAGGVVVCLSPGWTAERFHAVRTAEAAVRDAAVVWAEAMHEMRTARDAIGRNRDAAAAHSLSVALSRAETRHATLYAAYTAARAALAKVTP